ncbi:esterase/lipase family protein [Rathayibacter oskolensis]|nr:hypothetical protein [Rathayibacter oskolensis]
MTGTIETVVATGAGGQRRSLDGSLRLTRALEAVGAEHQYTIVLDGLRATSPNADGDSRAPRVAAAPTIDVSVPSPPSTYGEFLVYVSEDDVVSFHFPEPTDDSGIGDDLRAPGRTVYRVPRALVASTAAGRDRGDQTRRWGSRIAAKLLKIVFFPLRPALRSVGGYFAREWESTHALHRLRTVTEDDYDSEDAPNVRGADHPEWAAIDGRRALLLLHGTFSTTAGAFRGLPPGIVGAMARRYAGILAFDHPTVSVAPDSNAAAFEKLVPDGLDVELDIVAHSRGGLVARELVRRQVTGVGLGPGVRIRSVTLVATPNAGTALAEFENLSHWVDRAANLVSLIEGPGDVLAIILTVVKHLAVGVSDGLTGLTAMQAPEAGNYLATLNVPESVGSTVFHTIASDFEPAPGSPFGRIARDAGLDVVFGGADNDLVVPTEGVSVIPSLQEFAPVDPYCFTTDRSIDHSAYFAQREVTEKLTQWLGLT